jgi:hypothetical protein
MENQSIQIAKTIQEQLFAFGKMKVWSWGANAWTAIENGLQFKVQGFKFKGTVKITLHPSDYYIIEFIKSHSAEPIHKVDMCYFDEMNNIIDNYVEYTGKDYASDIANAVYSFQLLGKI